MKQTGLGGGVWVSGYDLSGDFNALGTVATPVGTTTLTGVDKSAEERGKVLIDGNLAATAFFNPETAHPALSSLPRADRIFTYAVNKTAVGDPAASMIGKQINYDPNRAANGAYTIGVQAQANGYGLEWGQLLTPGVVALTEAAATASLNVGDEYDFGLQAYLHVFEFTGTDATITIQQSSDDDDLDAWAAVTGGAFTEVATLLDSESQVSERIQTARDQTIEQYLRVNVTTSAGFTSLSYAIMVKVNKHSTVF